ncbi:MAG: hypothetical protein HY300_20175 [Verrucomicrobia bacterium]|nr:hypothetical protein [Verrucomicrobiota bacterium]
METLKKIFHKLGENKKFAVAAGALVVGLVGLLVAVVFIHKLRRRMLDEANMDYTRIPPEDQKDLPKRHR